MQHLCTCPKEGVSLHRSSTVQAQVLADKLYTADERRLALWSKRLVVLSVVAWLYGLFEGFDKALPILFVVGLALAIRGLKDPALGLMGVGILATIDAPARVYLLSGGLLRWNTFNYWLLIVIVLNVRFLLRLRDLQTRLLELFTLLLLLQFVVTPDFVNGAQHILGLVSVFGLLVYFVRALAAHEAVLEPVALVNGVVAAVGGLVFYTQIQDLPYINPNAFAHFPLMGLFSTAVLLELRKRQGPTGNLLYYLLLAINFAWVFLSGSRGGILIAATAVTLVWLGYRPLSPKGFVRSFLLLAIGLVLFLGLLSQFTDLQQRTIERFEKAFDTSLTLKSRTSGRSWRRASRSRWHWPRRRGSPSSTSATLPPTMPRSPKWTTISARFSSAWRNRACGTTRSSSTLPTMAISSAGMGWSRSTPSGTTYTRRRCGYR